MPSSAVDATKAYVDESMVVAIDLASVSFVKPFELLVASDAGVGVYGFVMSMT